MANGIHQHCGGTFNDCRCIIHRIFSGILQSDLKCHQCGHTSTAADPFFDISVDLPHSKQSFLYETSPNIAMPLTDNNLFVCLQRYVGAGYSSSVCPFL
jgi:hypothetical protein